MLLFAALLLLIGYFIVHSYVVQLNIHKSKILTRLEAVAKTASNQIDGNQLEYIHNSYPQKDEIKTNYQDRVYQLMNERLMEIKELNNLKTSIYTLTLNTADSIFYFGVNSEKKPYYNHTYDHYPPELLENYEIGGKVNVYEDENGHWLSAFAPIKNSSGKVVAVVQADNNFDDFLKEARTEIFKNIGVSLIFVLVIIFFLVRSMRSILLTEDKLTAKLIQSKLELEIKSKETLDSILYAKRIQEAILPLMSKIKSAIPESFVFHLPRDIVSGDFYWFTKQKNKVFIASVDCTGHGVPGAFMSMIGTVLLDDIVEKKGVYEPDEILNELHLDVVKALKQNKREKASKDGMDIALCVLDFENETLSFAGAFRPLIQIKKNGEVNRIKSNSAPIGGFSRNVPKFVKHELPLVKGDTYYIYSDGYADQFGGEQNRKYMTRNFRNLLQKISQLPIEDQKQRLESEFHTWRGTNEQVDDVLVIGFRI